MAISLCDVIITYIDDALDIDDFENLGDIVRSEVVVKNIEEWQLTEVLRKLHADLMLIFKIESDRIRRFRLKMAITHLEADFSDYLFSKETETTHNNFN